MGWTDRTDTSQKPDISIDRYPLGYWELQHGTERIERYYLDKLPYGQWRLNPEDGTDVMYFNELESAKVTVETLARMNAIKPEDE